MTPRRTIEIRTLVRVLPIAAGLSAGLSLGTPAPAATAAETLLQPTPLVLKDGRIANVSVQVLSFPPGQSTLDAADARRLSKLSAELATDCFLTAQVIGHVGSNEVGNDTLSAHRLARARADAVQASLIADGLPAKAIASVWDWQFMVREPRATIWVFRLTPGEDCQGKRLDSTAPALVAETEPSSATTPASPGRPAVLPAREAPAERVASAARDQGPQSAAAAPDHPAPPTTVVRAAEAPRPTAVAVPAGPARAPAAVPSVTKTLPAASPSPAEATADSSEAKSALSQSEAKPVASQPEPKPAVSQPEPNRAAVAEGGPAAHQAPDVVAALPERPAEPAATPEAAGAGANEVAITFPTNSSYFPPGTGTQLHALLKQLGNDRGYQVIVQVSVSGATKVVGAESPEDAAKYNRWLADRRLDRVRSWFEENVKGSTPVIKPEYHANDESRQLVVRLAPLS
jgi:outer membrane protein OmpA-like peptidoglycan-associated protein